MKLLLALFSVTLAAQHIDPSSLDGKVLLGYQGWFRCPGGGTMGTNWSHWANGAPTAASLVIDMYPDLREFDPGETCAVPGMSIGANPATLFSSGKSRTVARHFEWMQHYGLDGVLLQRFVTDIPGSRNSGDAVLKNVMAAAERYGRVFAIEYDISGANPATVASVLQQDWRYLVETHKVTAHPRYLRHNGKPVVSVWGIGLNDTRHPPSTPDAALALIRWFQAEAGVAYIGGTPAYWRTFSNDAATDPRWTEVYQAMDGIQPWTVGRYATLADINRWQTTRLLPDLAETTKTGQLYMPVIFPGFSWFNLNRTARQNQIPRLRGEFLWRQAYNAKAAGARMLKIAMFDEVNESTAMFKLAPRREDAPDQGFWLTLDADGFTLPSDWYLRLAGEITRGFHGQSPLEILMPETPGPPWPDSSGAMALSPATLAPESIFTLSAAGLPPGTATVIDSTGVSRNAPPLSGNQYFTLPQSTAPGPAALVFATDDGVVLYGKATVAPVAPGLFPAATLRVLTPDGAQSVTSITACLPGSDCQPGTLALGPPDSLAFLELYGTGIRGRSTLEAVTCTIAGIDAPVLFAGPQTETPGLDQVTVSLPRALQGTGLATIRLLVNGVPANDVQVAFR